ncbi:hypothetical protein AVEN_123568-1 [Araneus ventricosus]|uniref:Uncharacterized protein n=1 Tax=Araneus ventricosus TaxID=182803 RepID=A0A4Y2N0N9_ARAVE|nr:hypothetical protein AVEN_123568-1 [Araneus ventricosus]
MDSVVSRVITMILLYIFSNSLVSLGRKSPKNDDALYECVQKQMCECDIPQRFSDCFSMMTDNSQKWLVGVLNSCQLVELQNGEVTSTLKKLCALDRFQFKPCFNGANIQLKQRVITSSTGIYGADESPSFEKARNQSVLNKLGPDETPAFVEAM